MVLSLIVIVCLSAISTIGANANSKFRQIASSIHWRATVFCTKGYAQGMGQLCRASDVYAVSASNASTRWDRTSRPWGS